MMKVEITKIAVKALKKAPLYVREKFNVWVSEVENAGIRQARLNKGLHDEPLQGTRDGQRSIRLSRHWRAIYIETEKEILITVLEVSHHDYRTS